MKMLGLLALVCAAAGAQELPPVGTYQAGVVQPLASWPDPKTLTPPQRVAMEALLRDAHERAITRMLADRTGMSVREASYANYLGSAAMLKCALDRQSKECATLSSMHLDLMVSKSPR